MIPGFVRDTWFRAEKVGDYYGQCAELCGKEHAYMPIHVKVVGARHSAWVEDQKKKAAAKLDDPAKVWTLDDMLKRGKRCTRPTARPATRPTAGRWPIKPLDGSAIVLDADHAKQIQILLNGAPTAPCQHGRN